MSIVEEYWLKKQIKMKQNSFEQNLHASIIGYWRNGMTNEEIRAVTDLTPFDIERIIFNYSKGIK